MYLKSTLLHFKLSINALILPLIILQAIIAKGIKKNSCKIIDR